VTAAGHDVDVLVAGGGPVGLATAILAAHAGFSTLVLERRHGLVDKACGEGLMPGALAALRELGADPPGRDFGGIRYVDAAGGRTASARFRAGPGRGVRRTALSRTLADVADAAGVKRATGVVADIRQEVGAVTASGVRARWLVGADGLHSAVRRELGLDGRPSQRPRFGLRRHFATAPWSDLVEVHWSSGAEAYVTPVADDLVGVAVLTAERGRPYDEWLADFPLLRERLAGADAVTGVLGAGPLEQNASRRVAGRVLLVGDAAGYVDALTGEGVAVGLAQSRALVDCLARGRPADYEAAWRAASRRYRWLTRGVLYAAQHGRVRRSLVPAAAALPSVFRIAVDALA
jgi:flavin-dependent dehydrogenase